MDSLDIFDTANHRAIKITVSKDNHIFIEGQPSLWQDEPKGIRLHVENGTVVMDTIFGPVAFLSMKL